MHEISIATALVDQVICVADKNKLRLVEEVEIEVGVLRQLLPDVMQFAYRQAALDTIAGKSTLIISEVKAKALCNNCGLMYEPDVNDFICPVCNAADFEICSGNEIMLKSVVGNN